LARPGDHARQCTSSSWVLARSVAKSLVSEANDITTVDTDIPRMARLADRLDLRVMVGNAALPPVIKQVEAKDADLLIAVTIS
jgi:trk system potassium uptake protein